MSRHEIHIELKRVSTHMTIATVLFFIVSAMLFFTIPAALYNSQTFIMLIAMIITHNAAFSRCIKDLICSKQELEKTLEELNSKGENCFDDSENISIKEMIKHNIVPAEKKDNDSIDSKKGD